MGLTLIRKSDATEPIANPKIALVLAGGAISGGAFKVGGLKALNDFLVERKITDMDIYVGLSAGAILGASLAAGVTPDEMIKVLDGSSTRLDQLRPFDFYNPNWSEFGSRPAKFSYDLFTYLPSIAADFARGIPGLPEAIGPTLRDFARQPSYTRFESLTMALLDPGNEIIFGDPYFPMYPVLATLPGARAVIADTYPDCRLTAARVEPLITDRTKIVLLNSPGNP